MGIGFGYSSATPPALKWFPPAKTGLIVGIVVSGFGLASVYIAPLSTYLLKVGGISWAMMVLGIAFAIIVSLFSLLLANPPAGYTPSGSPVKTQGPAKAAAPAKAQQDLTPMQLLKNPSFYVMWIAFFHRRRRRSDGYWQCRGHGQAEHGRAGVPGGGYPGGGQCRGPDYCRYAL
jgi:predicted MFS family arabinose efflux permease